MNENRAQALDRLLTNLDRFDLFNPRYNDTDSVVTDVAEMLRPFLQNPEKHEEHIQVMIEYANTEVMARAFNPIIRLYNLPFLRGMILKRFAKGTAKFRARVLQVREQLLASVDPGELRIDLLPITNLPTKADWKKQKRRLILLETRGAVYPGAGMVLRGISHRIEIRTPTSCQFVDSSPASAMELIDQRKSIVSEKGKFVRSVSLDGTLNSSLKAGAAAIESSLTSKESETIETESGGSEEISHSSHMARVISSAVGSTAVWELLRTPTQNLLGSTEFSATALVPTDTAEIEIAIHYSADIDGWGPATVNKTLVAEIPALKG
jgi:hypothetical protein